jgi:hypothetical protein
LESELIKLNEISFACNSKVLFVKCKFSQKKLKNIKFFFFVKGANDDSRIAKLFAHSLRLISKLDDYFTAGNDNLYSDNYLPSCLLNQRMNVLMKQRINEQYYRKERLMSNWSKLHEQKNI